MLRCQTARQELLLRSATDRTSFSWIYVPIIDGWEAARRLKAQTDLRSIPIIALTAHAMHGDEAKARASGCDDFLTKPIDEVRLFQMLNRYLGTNVT